MGFYPFLRQVADYYSGWDIKKLARLCFVFPNQRSSYFFTEYFKNSFVSRGGKALIMPRTTTFSSLAESWSGLIEAEQTELMLLLYKTYLDNILNKNSEEEEGALAPDRFLFWSEIILNDFSDIDMALADAGHLFRNLKDLKELQTNPLTDQQLELIKQFWDTTGAPWINEEEESRRMWVKKKSTNAKEGVRNFLRLWEVLGPLYDSFQEALKKEGLCYRGLSYRKAYENLTERLEESDNIEGLRYIFVGFSSLSRSEKKILDLLKKSDNASFHWDLTMPRLGVENDFPLRMVNIYSQRYPAPEDFELKEPDYEPAISVYSVSTEIGQVKMASEILRKDMGLTPDSALKYATVLPESSLCVPLLNSLELKPGIDANITMGFPLKDTAMSSLIESLATMHLSRQRDKEGNITFYKPSIKSLVTHASLMKGSPKGVREILSLLREERRLHIPAADIQKTAPSLAFLFNSPDKDNVDDVLDFLIDVAANLKIMFRTLFAEKNEGKEGNRIEFEFLEAYHLQLLDFKGLVDKYSLQPYIANADTSVMEAIRKMIRRISVSFAGTPLKGIQIMGILETRALDFEDIIITSMNERSFPRKLQKATFLPQTLREAYGLENRADEETVMAYHFYRLISRARRIHLLYNNDTEGLKSGEMSRYLYQLKYLYRCPNLKEYALNYASWVKPPTELRIEKDDRVIAQLREFISGSGTENKRHLSASSIKKLLSCPLEFYLSVVCRLSDEEEDYSHIDDSMYGTIVHNIMEEIYMEFPKKNFKGKDYPMVNAYHLGSMLATNTIEEVARRVVNKEYIGLKEGELNRELQGESQIFYDLAVKSVRALLKAEINYLNKHHLPYFLFVQAEMTNNIELKIDDELSVNFVYIIDRVDRMFRSDNENDSYLRIIDYKTGKDALEFPGVESLVNYEKLPQNADAPKAITQLMLYSIAYSLDKRNEVRSEDVIQPMIYRFRDVVRQNGEIKHLKDTNTKQELKDYKDLQNDFSDLINARIKDFFDPNVAILQSKDTRSCAFCEFKEICSRG